MIKIQNGHKKGNIMIEIGNIRTLDPKFDGKQYLIVRSLYYKIRKGIELL